MKQFQRLSALATTELSDALDACGVAGCLLTIKPLLPGSKLIGSAYTIKYSSYESKPETFKGAADYIDAVPAGAVLLIDNQGRSDCTTWGDILTQTALLKKIAGTVVYGAVRDVAAIRAAKYPLFASATAMCSGKNRVYKSAELCELSIQGVKIRPGDILFGDDDGVLVIPKDLLEKVITKAENIKITEQKIVAAVRAGSSLAKARKDFRYDQPWLNKES